MKVLFETKEELRDFVVVFDGNGYSVALSFDGKHNILTYKEFLKEAEWFDAPLAIEMRK